MAAEDSQRFIRFINANKPVYSSIWSLFKWLNRSYPEDYIIYKIFYCYQFELEHNATISLCSYLNLETLYNKGFKVYNELCEDTISNLIKLILYNQYYIKYDWDKKYSSYKIVEIATNSFEDNKLLLYSKEKEDYITIKITKVIPTKNVCFKH